MNAAFSSRRRFLKHALGASLTLAAAGPLAMRRAEAIEPFRRRGAPRFPLSLAAYSFRDFFNHKDTAKRITLFDFIDYCADQGLAGTELTSYYFPAPVTEAFLLQVRRHAFLRGVAISGTAVGNNFALPPGEKRDQQIALVKKWVDHAAVLGAPHIRVFAGSKEAKQDMAEAKQLCVAGLEECCEYAGNKGIFLGLENHHGIVAEVQDMLDIVRAVKSPWLGVNLDTGNFYTDDPYADLAQCAPYTVNVQLKVEIRRRGQRKGEPADLPRLAKILREANYQGYIALEYEGAEDPWVAVPVWLKKMKQAFGV
jgi:sugar phosphate isomerase/epimerase